MSHNVAMTVQPRDDEWIPEIGYGDRLRRIRLDLKMDQRQFAESIQMNHATYAAHELSHHIRRGARLVANSIELRHHVPAWWILGDECPGPESNWGPTPYESVSWDRPDRHLHAVSA